MAEAVAILTDLTGTAPLGWYTGRDSPHTRDLVVEHGGFVYDSDSYADDLPYWMRVRGHEITSWCPTRWTPTTCGSRSPGDSPAVTSSSPTCATRSTCSTPRALPAPPKMLSVGLHCRIVGRPARAASLERFLDHVQAHDQVWIARRIDIAEHWRVTHPPNM